MLQCELCGVSGLDSAEDGRAFVWLDYDRDGRIDIAKVNANAPLLQLFHNEIEGAGNFVAIRLLGQGVGAWIEGIAGGVRVVRESHAGEGFAAQNSRTLLIGIGDAPGLTDLTVRWPSGAVQEIGEAVAGTLLIVDAGGAVEREPWIRHNATK